MKKQFSTKLFGYSKDEVDRHLEYITKDYEEELRKKRERLMELAEENRRLKQENQEQKERIERFAEQERYISRALIKAEQRAQAIVEEGQRKAREEYEQINDEKEKWKNKFREVRNELLVFEKSILSLIEKFRDEINYYTAKEISEVILMDENDTGKSNVSTFSRMGDAEAAIAADDDHSDEEVPEIDEIEEIDDKKGKVIA
ncbi:MAG TPA: DivIVA domain-containing protein [Clostridiales bacterium]|nr:DivIVA domain-containing protein [Clostridiales bacterium]